MAVFSSTFPLLGPSRVRAPRSGVQPEEEMREWIASEKSGRSRFGLEGDRAGAQRAGSVARGPDRLAPGRGDHRREMFVRMIENETFDASRTVSERLAERPRRRVIEDTGAGAQPPPIQPVESRSVEGGDGMLEARIRRRW
jgi:hypothetical protein